MMIFPAEVSSSIFKLEGRKFIQGLVRDITERKISEEKVHSEREQLLSIFEGIDEPIYVVNPDTYEVLYANNALLELFGKDVIGKTCFEVFQNINKSCDFCTNDKILGENYGKND